MSSRKEKRQPALPLFYALNDIPLSSGFAAHVVLAAEFLDTARGVHDLLGAGVERMALGADFDVQSRLADGGAGVEFVATAASHFDFSVCRMDIGSHFVFLALGWARLGYAHGCVSIRARIIHKNRGVGKFFMC
jgi:hypothetical protein